MGSVPLHPMIVHIPMALAVLMPLVAGGILFAWWRGYSRKRTWSIVCALQAVMLVASLFAMRSGEEDEDRVEEVVAESVIERHEEAAEQFTWGCGLLLVVSLLPILLRNQRHARVFGVLTLTGSFVILGLGYNVGSAGGELVYQHGAAAAFSNADGTVPGVRPRGDRDHDEDDDHR